MNNSITFPKVALSKGWTMDFSLKIFFLVRGHSRFFYLRIKVNNEHKEIKFMGNNTMKMTKYKRWVLYGLTGICLLGGRLM